ncbi:MAG: citrate/2-methylcitrate synthase [Deltaproteobacteria bacterium]|nr:citrate/2-methylcitrate synthase [Deltaproteobacteria bacterium]
MVEETKKITEMILDAAQKAREETSNEPEPELTRPLQWPIQATIGPGLEGAIACESKIGYVNGSKGWLIYRGYDIFDLCAYSTFEEVSYLLLMGKLPTAAELEEFKLKLINYRFLNQTLRMLMSSPVESMNTMSALRLGTLLTRRLITLLDLEDGSPTPADYINSDEDSIPMETAPIGELHAIYEFKHRSDDMDDTEACFHLIAGLSTITAAISRIRQGRMPLEPNPKLSHAANLLYMITGREPTAVEERVMDIALILHADHGMNASTFAAMVVASTLSDIYFSVGAGIAALNGPLHGGANEQVVRTLIEIGDERNVKSWVEKSLASKGKIMGFGHRVYKTYDPRARVLGVLAKHLAETNESIKPLFNTAQALEKEVGTQIGTKKKIFPNVDFFSGIVYSCLGIAPEMFTPIFAVSRVSGWTARVLEYLENNRIFRPRAMYTGEFNKGYIPLDQR